MAEVWVRLVLLWENGEFCALSCSFADVFACCGVVLFNGQFLGSC